MHDILRPQDRDHSRLSVTQGLMLRGLGVILSVAVLSASIGAGSSPVTADDQPASYTGTIIMNELERLRRELDRVRGDLELVTLARDRADAIMQYSADFRAPADLGTLIYDTALREGMDPELAFRLVRLESGFKPNAKSRANAYGLAQVQPATARHYEADITVEKLLEPERNLRIGIRYLRDLLERYQGDVELALLAYNRGPSRVQSLLDRGRDPRNGYASIIMEGYGRVSRGPDE